MATPGITVARLLSWSRPWVGMSSIPTTSSGVGLHVSIRERLTPISNLDENCVRFVVAAECVVSCGFKRLSSAASSDAKRGHPSFWARTNRLSSRGGMTVCRALTPCPPPRCSANRSGATRGRGWNCDTEMSPTVLPVVSHRDVRRWQRRGAKLPGQRILTLRGGRESVSRHGDCQHRGGRGPGSGGMVNPGEAP